MIKTALRFIRYDKPKSIGALMGTVMSVFLIGQQSGIFMFLTNSMAALVRNNQSYIWVVDDKTTNVNALGAVDIRIGNELQSLAGVSRVFPLVTTGVSAKFRNGTSAGLTLIGVQAPGFAGGPWDMFRGTKEVLLRDGAIITDYFNASALGELKPGEYFEINGKQVFNAGLTKGVDSFGGIYAFTTIERARYLSGMSTDKANAFLVELKDEKSEKRLIAVINQQFYGVHAWSGPDLTRETIYTVLATSGIAFSFGTIIVFALFIGFVIIGLTLYSSVIDRIKDYGTLKAIGATNRYIRNLILTQALIIACSGFVIGTIVTEIFRKGIATTGTIFSFPLWMRFAFLLITLIIAFFGSLFAIRRITRLEPGAVFRS